MWAVRGGSLVQHGYRRPRAWHANVNVCPGRGAQHFGTVAGRDYAERRAERLREAAAERRDKAARVAAGDPAEPVLAQVLNRARWPSRYEWQPVPAPNPLQRADYERKLVDEARNLEGEAYAIEQRVSEWKPADPVRVDVA
jgi:hypothetical protein